VPCADRIAYSFEVWVPISLRALNVRLPHRLHHCHRISDSVAGEWREPASEIPGKKEG
jgi:hypothetical protein